LDVWGDAVLGVLENEDICVGFGEFFPVDILVVADLGLAGGALTVVIVLADADKEVGGAQGNDEVCSGGCDGGDADSLGGLGGGRRGRDFLHFLREIDEGGDCDSRHQKKTYDSRLTHSARMVELSKIPVKPCGREPRVVYYEWGRCDCTEAKMQETDTFLNRIGRLFKRGTKPGGNGGDHSPVVSVETNATTLRPWKKNTAAIAQLQNGFNSLTDLMDEIRQNMVSQGSRQDQLISYLSALPKLLETIPENNRIQGEALKAIHNQLEHNTAQAQTLGEILEKMSQTDGDQKDLLEGLRERVETLNHQDKMMTDSLNSVSAAMEQSSKHSAAGTQVLETLRENLKSQSSDLERVIRKQNERFTVLLTTAVSISFLALAAVLVVGYVIIHQNMK